MLFTFGFLFLLSNNRFPPERSIQAAGGQASSFTVAHRLPSQCHPLIHHSEFLPETLDCPVYQSLLGLLSRILPVLLYRHSLRSTRQRAITRSIRIRTFRKVQWILVNFFHATSSGTSQSLHHSSVLLQSLGWFLSISQYFRSAGRCVTDSF